VPSGGGGLWLGVGVGLALGWVGLGERKRPDGGWGVRVWATERVAGLGLLGAGARTDARRRRCRHCRLCRG